MLDSDEDSNQSYPSPDSEFSEVTDSDSSGSDDDGITTPTRVRPTNPTTTGPSTTTNTDTRPTAGPKVPVFGPQNIGA